jgi:hypothetical protein
MADNMFSPWDSGSGLPDYSRNAFSLPSRLTGPLNRSTMRLVRIITRTGRACLTSESGYCCLVVAGPGWALGFERLNICPMAV